MPVKTITERKEEVRSRKLRAVAELKAILRTGAPPLGGRFLLYGSAARGELRHNSDVDLLLDFPETTVRRAYGLAEEACAQLGLAADLTPVGLCSETFFRHVMAEAEPLE